MPERHGKDVDQWLEVDDDDETAATVLMNGVQRAAILSEDALTPPAPGPRGEDVEALLEDVDGSLAGEVARIEPEEADGSTHTMLVALALCALVLAAAVVAIAPLLLL